MKRAIKRRWVKALTSGKYKKGTGHLRPTPTTYCCLGVLCDLYAKEKRERWTRNDEEVLGLDDSGSYNFSYVATIELPHRVREWAGITEHEAGILADLANMNDGNETPFGDTNVPDPMPFAEIAIHIEHAL